MLSDHHRRASRRHPGQNLHKRLRAARAGPDHDQFGTMTGIGSADFRRRRFVRATGADQLHKNFFLRARIAPQLFFANVILRAQREKLHDLLGITSGYLPRFVKAYADLKTDITRAVTQYRDEVRSGAFPDKAHGYE
jgi:hypothetical protein